MIGDSRPRWGRFDVRIDGRPRVLRLVAALMNVRSRLTGIATGDQGMFITRALFDEAGGFPDLPLMEDVALSRRLKSIAGRPACLASRVVTSGRRWEARGPWRTIVTMWRLRFDYWRGVDPAVLARRYAPGSSDGSTRYSGAPAAAFTASSTTAPAAAHDARSRAGTIAAGASAATTAPILQVFLKAPVPGHVKTRLAAAIGDAAAAALYVRLVERALDAAVAARAAGTVAAVELWYAGTGTGGTASEPAPAMHPALTRWAARSGATLHPQLGADLGARMRAALRSALDRGRPALLIGSDCPGLDAARLAAAAAALRDHDAVFLPAEDGGYVLVGLARDVDAFTGIAWSSAEVMAATRARLAETGTSWLELPALWDVDLPGDIERLAALDPSFASFAGRAAPADTGSPLATAAVLVAVAAVAATTWPPAHAADGDLAVGAFSRSAPGAPLPAGWSPLTFPRIDRHTRYSLVADSAAGTVVRADANASASGLTRKLDAPAAERPLLRWSWKVEQAIEHGDVTRKEGDDYPARIYVSFRYTPERLSLVERAKYAAARVLYGEYPPHAGINYIWDAKAAVGTTVPNPFTDRVRMVVVERGTANLGQWRAYERDIVADYRRAFGEDPPPIAGIALMTDADNTGESAIAYYGDITLAPRR